MFLIIGGDSEIGAAAARAIRTQGHAVAATTRRRDKVAPDRPFLDLAAPLDDWEPPPGTRSVCICAAIARLADCAADRQRTAHINVTQTLALIDKLLARGIYVLFLSSNQVFDGRLPHVPVDAPYSPVSEYGRQKAEVETALRGHIAHGAAAAILRLAKVVSPGMPLLEGWAADLSRNKPIRAFSDMTLAPAPAGPVCAAIGALLQERASGIFQLTGPRDVAYVDLGRFLAAHIGAEPSLVEATSARAAGLPEGATPRNTTLDSSLLRDRYGLEAPDVWEVIADAISTSSRRSGRPRSAK
jgi:dTDP-4-dehydrorhamnose reductase